MKFEAEGSDVQVSWAGSGCCFCPQSWLDGESTHCLCHRHRPHRSTHCSCVLASHLGAVMVKVGVSQRKLFIIAKNKMSHVAKAGASVQDRRNLVCSLSQLFLRPLVTTCLVVTVFLCGMATCL